MLGKLLKHEFRAAGRILLPVWAALLVLGIFTNLSARVLTGSESALLEMLGALVIALFVIGCIAAIVMAIVTMVMRFQKSLLSREGYLTHTLPVNVHQLIWSRMIVAVVYLALTILVVIGSILIAAFHVGMIQELAYIFKQFFAEGFSYLSGNFVGYVLELLALMIISGLSSCLMFYAALSIGHSFANHKMLLSVAFYFAIYTVTEVLGTFTIFFAGSTDIFQDVLFYQTQDQFLMSIHLLLLGMILFSALLAAIYYILTTLMLKRRLNLE